MESDDSDTELMAEAEELVTQAGLDLGAGVQAPQIHNPNDYDDDEDCESHDDNSWYEVLEHRVRHSTDEASSSKALNIKEQCAGAKDTIFSSYF